MLVPKVARVFLRKRRGEAGQQGDQQPSQKEILITNETIESLLHLRQVDAANQLGISLTALKNACKYLGFDDWPTARSNLIAAQHGRSGELPSLVTAAGQGRQGARRGRSGRERSMSEREVGGGRGEKRRALAESLPELRSHVLEDLMLDALEHVADL